MRADASCVQFSFVQSVFSSAVLNLLLARCEGANGVGSPQCQLLVRASCAYLLLVSVPFPRSNSSQQSMMLRLTAPHHQHEHCMVVGCEMFDVHCGMLDLQWPGLFTVPAADCTTWANPRRAWSALHWRLTLLQHLWNSSQGSSHHCKHRAEVRSVQPSTGPHCSVAKLIRQLTVHQLQLCAHQAWSLNQAVPAKGA